MHWTNLNWSGWNWKRNARAERHLAFFLILVNGLAQPKKPNTDEHGFPRMNTDAPRPIRPADPGSRGRRGDALGSVLGRPPPARRAGPQANPGKNMARNFIRVYPWNIFRTPWLQSLNEPLSLDFKASWSGGAKPITMFLIYHRLTPRFRVVFCPHHRSALARPRSQGTGAGLPLSVFIGVHRWLTLAFQGRPKLEVGFSNSRPIPVLVGRGHPTDTGTWECR